MAQGQGGRVRAHRTPAGLPRAVNMVVASHHHALPWHKAKGGGCARNVPIGQRALDWLVAYIDRARPALVEQSTTQRIFVSFSGKPFGDNCLSNLVTSFIQRAGITKPGSCHLFRHSAATLMMENGADLRSLQTLLGHASLNTTQIYTHVSIQHLKDVHDKTHPGNLPFKDSGSDSAETTE